MIKTDKAAPRFSYHMKVYLMASAAISLKQSTDKVRKILNQMLFYWNKMRRSHIIFTYSLQIITCQKVLENDMVTCAIKADFKKCR